MKKYRPFLVLFAILILPLLVYVYMKVWTKQNYKPIDIISEKLANPGGGPDSVFATVGDFSFASHTGDTLSWDSLKGKVWVANVFYTRCKDMCEVMNGWVKRLQEDFKDDPDVCFVSFSVDPRDSLAALRRYAMDNAAMDGKWYFLTGAYPALRKVVTEGLKFQVPDSGMIANGALNDPSFRLVDWNGHLRGQFYSGETEPEVVTMSQHLVLLLHELADLRSSEGGPP